MQVHNPYLGNRSLWKSNFISFLDFFHTVCVYDFRENQMSPGPKQNV